MTGFVVSTASLRFRSPLSPLSSTLPLLLIVLPIAPLRYTCPPSTFVTPFSVFLRPGLAASITSSVEFVGSRGLPASALVVCLSRFPCFRSSSATFTLTAALMMLSAFALLPPWPSSACFGFPSTRLRRHPSTTRSSISPLLMSSLISTSGSFWSASRPLRPIPSVRPPLFASRSLVPSVVHTPTASTTCCFVVAFLLVRFSSAPMVPFSPARTSSRCLPPLSRASRLASSLRTAFAQGVPALPPRLGSRIVPFRSSAAGPPRLSALTSISPMITFLLSTVVSALPPFSTVYGMLTACPPSLPPPFRLPCDGFPCSLFRMWLRSVAPLVRGWTPLPSWSSPS